MRPSQFLTELNKRPLAPAYLFLGPEIYQRERCRRALIDKALPAEAREEGLTRHDLESISLLEVLDDARSFSLFASERVIYVSGAEAALPRGRASEDEAGMAALGQYLKSPTDGVTLVFEASRYGFDGDDKTKTDRVRKYFGAVPVQVEFAPMTVDEATQLGRKMAADCGLKLGEAELDYLVELLDADGGRLQVELEKLSLFVGSKRAVTMDDLTRMVPNARASTIFALVNAIGQNQREKALDVLHILVQEGEYLPLALSFAGTQFRLALAAREAKLSSAAQIQAHFSKQGVGMWRARAEQVAQTVSAFSPKQLSNALRRVYQADKALRSASPDDRIVLEQFVLTLTGPAV